MSPKVENVSPRQEYDLVLAACGYEQRSRYMAETIDCVARVKMAIGYGANEEIAFSKNKSVMLDKGFSFASVSDSDFFNAVSQALRLSGSSDSALKILVDISCFTRFRLADLIRCLSDMVSSENLAAEVDFYYSLAEFATPPTSEPENEHLGPASEYFSGWSGEYTNPTVIISGLGYEYMKALGVIEYVDPSNSWLFFPRSPIDKYDASVRKANELILRDVDESHVIQYDVMDAPALVRDLFSLVAFLRRDYRCVLLPLGPKIFAFCAMLAGSFFRDVSVWRVSAGKYARPVDRLSSGHYAMFRVIFKYDSK